METYMTTTLRIDDRLKKQCDEIFDELGLTMTNALTAFLKQVVRTRSIPFIIGAQVQPQTASKAGQLAWASFERGRADRFSKGERAWTMDEINAEIEESRKAAQ